MSSPSFFCCWISHQLCHWPFVVSVPSCLTPRFLLSSFNPNKDEFVNTKRASAYALPALCPHEAPSGDVRQFVQQVAVCDQILKRESSRGGSRCVFSVAQWISELCFFFYRVVSQVLGSRSWSNCYVRSSAESKTETPVLQPEATTMFIAFKAVKTPYLVDSLIIKIIVSFCFTSSILSRTQQKRMCLSNGRYETMCGTAILRS